MAVRDRLTKDGLESGSGFIAAHPCPWCGGKLHLSGVEQTRRIDGVNTVEVEYVCDKNNCKVRIDTFATDRAAAKKPIPQTLEEFLGVTEPIVDDIPTDDAEIDQEQLSATAEQLARLDEVTKK